MDDVKMADLSQQAKDPASYVAAAASQENQQPSLSIEQNRLIQNVLLITLDAQSLGTSGPAVAIAFSCNNELLFNLDNVLHPFFERMLMSADQLRASLVQNPTGKWINRYGRADQSDVVAYLGECYIRLLQERRSQISSSAASIFRALEQIIIQNLRLGFQEPDLLAPQNIPQQLIAFYFGVMDQHSESVISLIHQLFNNPPSDFNSGQAAGSILSALLEKARKFTLMKMQEYDAIIHFVSTFSSSPATAKLLMEFCSPRNPRDAVACEQSLLGVLLRLSCLPEHNDVPPEFFVSSIGISATEAASTETFIWANTNRATNSIFLIINNIVRQSADLREAFLRWVGNCLSANFGRAKMWQPNMQFQIRLASDGFILNLAGVLLRLCRPFVSPSANPKILKIHPFFSVSDAYLRKMPEETTLIPKENLPPITPPTDFNFITSCFFLCHEAIRLGWRVVWERFEKFNRHINEIETRLEQAREAGNVAEQQEIEQNIHRLASRHLSMKAAMTVPENMELMIEFSVCTATWLAQMAVQPSVTASELPATYLPLFSPGALVEVPIQLAYIPELLVENVIEILTCNHRLPVTTGSTMNWKYEWMVELMNMLLVFMPSPNRMKNPHLRAKMAMMMHNMMPHKRFADTYQADTRNSMALALLDVPKEKLFREHPNKREFFSAILNIFVSIEMAGANLRFGEAFHYRRPLYALMEYLFTMDYHKERLEELAGEAVVNIEATNAPVFLRFLNLLINDSTYMLDEALNYMSKIKQVEQERPSWASLPEEQRQEKERDYHHQGEIARYHNILGRETIQCLKSLTKFRNPARILLNSVMVDRLASMLNYFLHCLVGADKRSQYKVKDLEHYSFKPRDLVEKICAVYVHLGRHDARKDFFLAICRDKRSYNPQLFREAQKVLDAFCRTNGDTGDLIDGIGQLAHSVQLTEAAENEEEELLTDEDVPDEFLDPIMSHLMRDPVHLPSSGKIVDRSTIARILLSDQSDPFNRQPLTMDLVKPADDLRKEIEAWIQKRRDAKNSLTK